jgi:hypothetical protein
MLAAQTREMGAGIPRPAGLSCQPATLTCQNEPPAALGYDGGVWYAIREGVRGVLVQDERREARVYVVCEPASHYYQVMTRSAWMPVLIGERI